MLPVLLAMALLQAALPTGDAGSPTPKGAPAADYEFVAWCHGALAGHMALYPVVKPELVSIERPDEVATDEKNDRLQLAAGREYLALYTRALANVDRGRAGPLLTRRRAAEAQGSAIWDPYKDAAPRQRMWAWVGWDLPGRCETAARKMLTPSGRLAAIRSAETTAEPSSIDDALSTPAAPPAAAPPDAATATAPSSDGSAPALRGPQ